MFDCGNVWCVKTGVLMESACVWVRTGDKNVCVREITWWTVCVCACVRALIPLRCGQVIRRSAAVQPRYRSPSDNGSHRRRTHSASRPHSNVKPFGETLPSGASCQRNDMGDRVALLLLAVAASALAAEVRKIRFFSGRICSFSTILLSQASRR